MVNSYCLRSKVKLVCDLKSLRRNVIMQVLFPAAVIVLVPVHRFLVGKSCILMRAKQTSSFWHERQCFTYPTPLLLLRNWFIFPFWFYFLCLILLLRHYELTNENVSYFLTNQSKTKTFIDLKVTRKPKPTKNSTRPYLYEIPVHFTHEIKTKGYDVIGVVLFHFKLMRFHFKKTG